MIFMEHIESHEKLIENLIDGTRKHLVTRRNALIDKTFSPDFSVVENMFVEAQRAYRDACIAYNRLKNIPLNVEEQVYIVSKRKIFSCNNCGVDRQHTIKKECKKPIGESYSIETRIIVTCNKCGNTHSDRTEKY